MAKPRRILIVEDNGDLRFMLRRFFESAGFIADEAVDGRYALECVKLNGPDIVLTDIFMPEFEGMETFVRLREAAPLALIVAMTGRPSLSGEDPLEIARELGAHLTVRKPFMPTELLKMINRLSDETDTGAAALW